MWPCWRQYVTGVGLEASKAHQAQGLTLSVDQETALSSFPSTMSAFLLPCLLTMRDCTLQTLSQKKPVLPYPASCKLFGYSKKQSTWPPFLVWCRVLPRGGFLDSFPRQAQWHTEPLEDRAQLGHDHSTFPFPFLGVCFLS